MNIIISAAGELKFGFKAEIFNGGGVEIDFLKINVF